MTNVVNLTKREASRSQKYMKSSTRAPNIVQIFTDNHSEYDSETERCQNYNCDTV